MKTLRIGIISPEKYMQRTIDMAAGRYKPKKNEPNVWFSSMKSCMEVLCAENIQLLDLIIKAKPLTIKELGQISGREQSNLSRTLKTLANYNLITLVKKDNKPLRPVAETSNFEILVKTDNLVYHKKMKAHM